MTEFKLVNYKILEKRYEAWKQIIQSKQEEPKEPISFSKGIVFAEEGYKYSIIAQGQEILNKFNWAEADDGKVVQMALELLGIRSDLGLQQNLVDYRDIMYLADQAYSAKLKDIVKGLHLLYVDGNDKDAFNLLAHALNKKYALISYFFFLKDSNKYQVVRPNNFAERFSMLGADPKCALNCSWDNYQKYMGALIEVKIFLEERHTDITLTDAHSYVWMLWMLSSK